MPLILLQAIATWVFYDRHWAAVSWRLSAGVAGDIGLLIEALKLADSPGETARLLENAAALTDLDFTLETGRDRSPAGAARRRLPEDQLTQAMQGRVDLPYRIAAADDPRGSGSRFSCATACLSSRRRAIGSTARRPTSS